MIVGYVLVGIFAGMIALSIALIVGASFWLALGVYTLTGWSAMVLLATTRMAVSILVRHSGASTSVDRPGEMPGTPTAGIPAGPQDLADGTSMSILAVDDDPFILDLIPVISATAGLPKVTTAASAEEAISLLSDSTKSFDFLLIDINMPGMDGIELCRQARQIPRYSDTPIIMLTAVRDMKNIGEAFRAGATDYATKPFDIEALGTRLKLVQQSINAQRESRIDSQRGTKLIPGASRGKRSEPPADAEIGAFVGLVEPKVLSNYLTQLPRMDVSKVQLFAISIDRTDTIRMGASSQQFASLLNDVVAAVDECFGEDRVLMTYTMNGTFLVVAGPTKSLSSITVEMEIQKMLQANGSHLRVGESTAISLSVGGPVQLQSAKVERARIATDRVISLVEDRVLSKASGRAWQSAERVAQ